jgi:hypothetical protein
MHSHGTNQLKLEVHFPETNCDMKHLTDINPNKFYTQLVLHGHLIEEVVEGVDDDGEWFKYYGFEDAEFEADGESTLNSEGNALYFFEGKVYDVVVYLENNEGTGINELDASEIKELIERLREESEDLGYSESEFLESQPWVSQFP